MSKEHFDKMVANSQKIGDIYGAMSVLHWDMETHMPEKGVGVRADAAHNQARAHTELAARYYQVGQVAVAVQEAQIALASDANYVPAQTLLALIYAELRQNKLADAHFERALKLSAAQNVSNTDLRNSYAWYLCQSVNF